MRSRAGRPRVEYARSGDVHIAYETIGEGPLDLVLVQGWVSHLEHQWDEPHLAAFLDRLSEIGRLVLFDKRGMGLSDRVPIGSLPTIDDRMDDVRAVMDAARVEAATLIGISEGGPMAIVFAATFPERVRSLVLYGTTACWSRADDHPWIPTLEEQDATAARYETAWGTPVGLETFAPTLAGDPEFRARWSRHTREAASPGAVVALMEMNARIDVRSVLPSLHVPTLVLHRTGDRMMPVESGRYLAGHIEGARIVELPGDDHLVWVGDADAVADEIEEFVTGHRAPRDPRHAHLTLVFTDIVGSTGLAAELGDADWHALLDRHDALLEELALELRGVVVKHTGDGFLFTFDGAIRALRFGLTAVEAVQTLGIEIRVGMHSGECERHHDDLVGVAVHIAARIEAHAAPSEVLVSRSVVDLAVGSGLELEENGSVPLRGLPGEWEVFAVRPEPVAADG